MTAHHYAIIAAKHWRQWGPYAAVRYARLRGATHLMLAVALQFETNRHARRCVP